VLGGIARGGHGLQDRVRIALVAFIVALYQWAQFFLIIALATFGVLLASEIASFIWRFLRKRIRA
jgi:hypothetical protein